MIRTGQKSLANPKKKVRVGCWNVRTLYSTGTRYKIGILGISECRWSGLGRLKTQTGETSLYSGRDDEVHQSGVALALDREQILARQKRYRTENAEILG